MDVRRSAYLRSRSDGTDMHEKGFYEKYIKRPQDFMLALIGMTVCSPVLLAVAVMIKIKLGSPVFFCQERPGRIDFETGKEKIFRLYKFRTMTDTRDSLGNLLPDKDRLTAFGRKLRASSLDELPELFNILKGDMAVVGPRPLLVQYLDRYQKHQRRRHEVRPGLTGLAQVNGRNVLSWEEKFAFDVAYAEHITFLGDWNIIFRTVLCVLCRQGISSKTSDTMEEFQGDDLK